MSAVAEVALPTSAIHSYCDTQPIAKLSILGKGFANWRRPDTDLGLLVEYFPRANITYFDMARQERELGDIVGCIVDLRTPNELEITTRQQIIAGATLVFTKNSRQ